jgi:hypothetical protein
MVDDLLDRLVPSDGVLCLDLRDMDVVERTAGAILSNALLGSLGDGQLEVYLDEPARDWIGTSGLAFALANRSGTTVINGTEHVKAAGPWTHEWRPGHVEPLRAMLSPARAELFSPGELGETSTPPDLFGPTFAAFVNPHLTRPTTLQRHPLTTLLWPWLDRLIPRAPGPSVASERRRLWVADVGRIVDEIVGNVCEHAGHRSGARIRSLVLVSVTRGGGARSTNRLHLCIQDTGPGIPATARPKMSPPIAAALSEAQLVGRLLEGTFAPWGRGRGQGLPRVVEICREREGILRVATKTTRASVDGSAVNSAVSVVPTSFRLDGTVVTLTLPVPRL